MSPPLILRNLSAVPLELKLVERFETPGSSSANPGLPGNFSDLGRNLTNFTSFVANTVSPGNSTSPTSLQLAENASSFARQDVSIRVDPFTTNKTDINLTETSQAEVLRLTFEADGQRYRIDVPSPQKSSLKFTPLQPDSRREFTGVFLPNESHLSAYSSANLNSWMRELKDDTPLSALSIPGTHNSPTYHRALPSVRCQAVSPREQLDNGVRFFDIRVQPESPDDPSKDGLILVHGVFPISLTGNKYLRELVNDTLGFLDDNPSETVIISLKREGPGQHSDQQLSRILRDHYAGDTNRWYTEPRIPRLGETRRKIVLMRRFALDDAQKGEYDGRGWGINAENWRYNCDNDTHGDVCVQDYCEVNETVHIDEKIRFAREHFGRSGQCQAPLPGINTDREHPAPPDKFYLNFLSASNFWKMGCWPEKIAAKLNPAMVDHLSRQHHDGGGDGDGSTGIVVCDWVGESGDWDLVRCIVGMNSILQMKEQRMG